MPRHRGTTNISGTTGDARLRLRAAAQLKLWGVVGSEKTYGNDTDPAYRILAHLLGKKTSLTVGFTEEDANTLEMLLGPNGYAIYRILLAKRGPVPNVVKTENDA